MDNKYQLVSTTVIKQPQHHHQQPHQQQQQVTLSEQDIIENFSQQAETTPTQPAPPPKVTVSLPKHAASRLLDLVQKRDIALLRLGIISVQFEDDQIIPLTLNTSTTNSSFQSKQQQSQQPSIIPSNTIIEPSLDDCNADCIGNMNTSMASLASLNSPSNPIIEEDEDLKPTINTSDSPILSDSSIRAVAATTLRAPSLLAKSDCNTSNLAVVYDDEDEDEKDDDEVVNEMEDQHSSYNIHPLSQLEFADPIDLEMYDSENLLFPDYTLNLS